MSALGQLLLWLGFLSGAFLSVCRLEQSDSPWATVPWGGYLLSVGVGVLGIVLIRRGKAAAKRASADSAASLESIRGHLDTIYSCVAEMAEALHDWSCEDVIEYIDSRCVPPIAEFADGREVIVNRFGSTVYADVMTEFASGERYLNRAWSAAADGYVDEVGRSIAASERFFHAAAEHLASAKN